MLCTKCQSAPVAEKQSLCESCLQPERATVIDAARFLQEAEKVAMQRIVARAAIDNEVANARLLLFHDEAADGYTVKVCMTMNGRDISFSYPHSRRELTVAHWAEARERIRERLVKELIQEFTFQTGTRNPGRPGDPGV